jgi:integrase
MNIKKLEDVTDSQWQSVNDFNKKITEEFLRESLELSDQTLKQYKSGLRQFFWWIKENLNNKSLLEVKSRDFLMYQNFLTRRGLSSSAIKFKRAAVSSLNGYVLTYYEDEYPTFKNFITKKIASPAKSFVHTKEPLTLDEYKHLISELEKKEEWQALAYLKFSFATGCRRNEARQLLKEVVNYQANEKEIETIDENGNKEVKIVKTYLTHDIRCKGRGKTGKVRKLQFDEEAMEAIKKWIDIRKDFDDCEYVFVTSKGKTTNQIAENTFNLWCKKIFEPIIGRRFHPHSLRLSRATILVVESNKDIKVAQKLLGHESSTTTEIYVIRKDADSSDEAFI